MYYIYQSWVILGVLYLSVRRIMCMVYVEGFIFLDYKCVLSLCLSFISLVALPQLYALFKTDKSFCNLNHLRELSFCGFTLLEQRQCSRMSAGSRWEKHGPGFGRAVPGALASASCSHIGFLLQIRNPPPFLLFSHFATCF